MGQSNIYFDLEEIEHVAGLSNNGEVFDYLERTGSFENYLLSQILVIIHEQKLYSYSQLEKYMYEYDKHNMECMLNTVVKYTEVIRLAFDGVYREMCEEKKGGMVQAKKSINERMDDYKYHGIGGAQFHRDAINELGEDLYMLSMQGVAWYHMAEAAKERLRKREGGNPTPPK